MKIQLSGNGTGISMPKGIIFPAFIIFCISDFGGTKALGWLTSLTLLTGTLTNLILLPVLINALTKDDKKKKKATSVREQA